MTEVTITPAEIRRDMVEQVRKMAAEDPMSDFTRDLLTTISDIVRPAVGEGGRSIMTVDEARAQHGLKQRHKREPNRPRK